MELDYKKTVPMLNLTIKYRSLSTPAKIVKVRKRDIRIPMCMRPVSTFEDLPDHVQIIFNAVSENMNTNVISLLSNSRKREIVEARQTAIYLCYEYVNQSPSTIGRWFNRDHSTVLHAISTINGYKQFDKKFLKRFHKLEAVVRDKLENENNLLDNQ